MSDEYWDDYWNKRFTRKRMPFLGRGVFGNVDEVFREMEEIMKKQFEKFSEMTPKELVRERTMPDGSQVREWGPFVYGYSMTVGPDGKPHIREFGNMKPGTRLGRPKIDIKEKREPLVDVIETDGKVKVVVELPGVEKTDVKLRGTETAITISVNTAKRKYYKEIELKAKVDTKKTKASFKNGVLEITLEKKKEEEFKGEPIML